MIRTLLLSLAIVLPAAAQEDDVPTPKPIERIAVVGASATDGFGVYVVRETPIGRVPTGWSLAKSIRAASQDTVIVSDLGTSMFFLSPVEVGGRLYSQALRSKADMIIAIDFLFWFAHGNNAADGKRMNTAEERLAMVERGLTILDRFDGPIIVGDLPDMRAAIGRMLSQSQVPSTEVRAMLNTRIHAWASERPRVRIFPLGEITETLRAGKPFEIGGHRWEGDTLKNFLQRDQLHPTLNGQIALMQVLEVLLSSDPEFAARGPNLDPDPERMKARISPPPTEDAPEKAVNSEAAKAA